MKIAPEVHEAYVTTNIKGNKQILVECLNALYGTMVASLLYYEKFTKSLKNNGYEVNRTMHVCGTKRLKANNAKYMFSC